MTLQEQLKEQPTAHEIEFMQCLLDRYSEDGGVVDIGSDGMAFLAIVRKHWIPRSGQLVPLPEVEELCIIYNQVLLNQPEDQRDQTKAMQAIRNHMKGKE